MRAQLPPLICIVGPTAVGKTKLAVALSRRFNGEIINADSRQVYRYMDIGTAKPTLEERAQAPHHLLDILNPDEDFGLGSFLSQANTSIQRIDSSEHLPMAVGGTGQYIWALVEGSKVPPVAPNSEFRRAKEQEAEENGPLSLHQELQSLDPDRAAQLNPRNVRRVIRALEIHHATQELPSSFALFSEPTTNSLVIGLNFERPELYKHIDERVDIMIESGLEEEARSLSSMGYLLGQKSLASPGYLEMGLYLSGEIDLDEAVQRTKFQTHRMARRQHTWFKAQDPRIHWLSAASANLESQAATLVEGFLAGG